MPVDLDEFHSSFFQNIQASAASGGGWSEDAFFDEFCKYLIEAGEFDTADRAPYAPAKGGIRVDGYGGDPVTTDGILSLIICEFEQQPEVQTLTATEMEALFKRLTNFLSKSLDERFRNSLEEAHPAFGLADLIAARWASVIKVRMFLITNKALSSRVDGKESGDIDGIPVTYSVWDITRLHRYSGAGAEKEEIVVDLEQEFGCALPMLKAHIDDAGYESYLLVMPGPILAKIYDRWHTRLLEQNVRVFLQARGGVNKGIRNTIENDPKMFFAYNNGISATTEQVETRREQNELLLTRLTNFQIVNGGQTTASIHAASRAKGVDISGVFVQMKLSVVPSSNSQDVVSKISEYANSQNKVSAADFFANHPFHVRMEEFSRRIYAPSPDGSFRQTKWFYERARGQYQDARGLLSEAQRKRFDLEYPKSQLISKTELAKFLNPWNEKPDIVSKGSQKNFAELAEVISTAWDKDPNTFGEAFFRDSMAKAIVFQATEKLVSEQPWYNGGGIRSRVVPYAIAKLVHDTRLKDKYVDLKTIWDAQAISEGLRAALILSSERVHRVIMGESGEVPNPLEWAKQQACWNRVKQLEIAWPLKWFESLLSKEEVEQNQKQNKKDQKMLSGIEAQILVQTAGPVFWKETQTWGRERNLLSPKEDGVISFAADGRVLTEKQAPICIEILRKLHGEGYQGGLGLIG